MNLGILQKNSSVFDSLQKENPPLVHSKALFHDFSVQFESVNSHPKLLALEQPSMCLVDPPKTPQQALPVHVSTPKVRPPSIISISLGLIQRDEHFAWLASNSINKISTLKAIESLPQKYGIVKLEVSADILIQISALRFIPEEMLMATNFSKRILTEIKKLIK